MVVEWRENPAGMRALLLTPAAENAMEFVGGIVRDEAERIAPVVTGAYAFGVDPPTGEHDGGFHVEPFTNNDAAAVRIVNRVRAKPTKKYVDGFGYGVALEVGTRYMHAQHILSRALDAVTTF
jgi:hypothetical protein